MRLKEEEEEEDDEEEVVAMEALEFTAVIF